MINGRTEAKGKLLPRVFKQTASRSPTQTGKRHIKVGVYKHFTPCHILHPYNI
jgi:hypothetical protein